MVILLGRSQSLAGPSNVPRKYIAVLGAMYARTLMRGVATDIAHKFHVAENPQAMAYHCQRETNNVGCTRMLNLFW